jgi:hypothetical protein
VRNIDVVSVLDATPRRTVGLAAKGAIADAGSPSLDGSVTKESPTKFFLVAGPSPVWMDAAGRCSLVINATRLDSTSCFPDCIYDINDMTAYAEPTMDD